MALNCPDGSAETSIRCQIHEVYDTCCVDHVERLDAIEQSGFSVFPDTVRWNSDDDWDQFTEVSISGQDGDPPDNTLLLTGSDGIGRVEGSGGTHTNDRRLYVLDGVEGSDFILYVDFALEVQQAQFGIGLRTDTGGDDQTAVVVWNNIFFSADAIILQGYWEFGDNGSPELNQSADSIVTRREQIFTAELDGDADFPLTLKTKSPHLLRQDQQVTIEFVDTPATLSVDEVVTATEVSITGDPGQTPDTTQLNVLGGTADTPDHADFDPGDTIDIRMLMSLPNWVPGGFGVIPLSQSDNSTDHSWYFAVESTGEWTFAYSEDGSTIVPVTSTVIPGFPPGSEQHLRVLFTADDDGGNHVVSFMTSSDGGMTWDPFDTVTTAGTLSLHNSTEPVTIGRFVPMEGRIKNLQVLIDSVTATDPDFEAQTPGAGSFDDSTGKTWTINAPAAIGVGPWTDRDGDWSLANCIIPKSPHMWRRLGVRLVGDRIWWKAWFPEEAEPGWDDPKQAASDMLPAILSGSGAVPPVAGGVGLLFNHLGSDRSLLVRDLEVHVLG